jgi:hypothetical protein
MGKLNGFIQPETLEEGREYYWLDDSTNSHHHMLPVRFVSYDPSPAFVIVSDETGRKRCLRAELFVQATYA